MKTIYTDDSNLVISENSNVLHSVPFLSFSFSTDGDRVKIKDERNNYTIHYAEAEDAEGNTFASAEGLFSYIKQLKSEPVDLGERVKVGNTMLSGVGGGLLFESVLGDTLGGSYLGVIERTNAAGDSELVVKRRSIDADNVEDASTAYQGIFAHSHTATITSKGRYKVDIDINAPEDGFTKEYRSKLTTTLDNGNIKVFNITQSPINPDDYKAIPDQTGWYISRRAYWKYLNNKEISEGLGFNGTVGDYGLPLVEGIEYKAGECYRVEITADNPFGMLGVSGAPDLFGGTQFIPYIERTYTGVAYSTLRTGTDVESAVNLSGQTMGFTLDPTSTNIILTNGRSFNVNSVKAIANADGTIHIISTVGGIEFYEKLDHAAVLIDGVSVTGGLNDVVNTLNELFTVGAFTSVVIADPYATLVADIGGNNDTGGLVGSAIDPSGSDIGAGVASHYNQSGYLSAETIDQAGEYFTFDIRNEGVIGFGLVCDDAADVTGNASYGNPAAFCSGSPNSGHYGFQFSHWFHPSPDGPWTNYGANASVVYGTGWNGSKAFRYSDEGQDWRDGNNVKMRVGIDAGGFISVEYYDKSTSLFIVCARTSYPVADSVKYKLGIKFGDSVVRLVNTPKVHLLAPAAPTMYFRYAESPDDNFLYPFFATEEEANYYDLTIGGPGTSSTYILPDDPTFTQWHTPTNGYTNNGTQAPTNAITFDSNPINWTEITTLTDADLAPDAFVDQTVTVNELSAVNIQVVPADADYTTTVTANDGGTLSLVGFSVEGTANEVTGDNVSNPSDTYTYTVERTNSYGSSSGTLTVVVTNLTAPVAPISGFNHHSGSTSLVDSDTLGDGSVVHMNTKADSGERFVIEKAYVVANVLPALSDAGDKYIIGMSNISADFTTVDLTDFDFAIVWAYDTASSHTVSFMRDGNVLKTFVVASMTAAQYDYALEVGAANAYIIGCNVNSIMNEPSPADGGVFSHAELVTSYDDNAPLTVHVAAVGTQADISTTDLTIITTPAAPSGSLTAWDKALDFSGGSEHLKQVTQSTGSNAIRMSGLALLATANADTSKTSSHTYSRPWATAIVFQTPSNTANQHIWNSGEGAGTGDDNIYLRMSGSNGELYFGWGREGVGYNEYHIGNFGGSYNQSTGQWWGIYISHDGTRLSAADATAANLNNAFEFRLMGTNDVTPVFDTLYDVGGDVNNWTSTGVRMDRDVKGDFTIGGRGSNRSFHGKVASMVVTTLVRGVTKPTDAEIKLMLTDPMKWEDDYKDGQSARYSYNGSSFTYGPSNSNSKYATQIWLMGDGASDSYSNGIRNQVDPTDQNNTKLQLNSMVSNDIQNVSINGLS